LFDKNGNDIANELVLPLPVWFVKDAAVLVAMITKN